MRLLMLNFPRLQKGFTAPIVFLDIIINAAVIFPHFSNALDTNAIIQADHNNPRILDLHSEVYGLSGHDGEQELGSYEPNFVGLDRSMTGRAEETATLNNNEPGKNNIDAGDSQYYRFPGKDLRARKIFQPSNAPSSLAEAGTEGASLVDGSSELKRAELESRQTNPATLYVTLNMCDQPAPTSSNPNGAPPPLQLYISTKTPKPDASHSEIAVPIIYGLGSTVVPASTDVYFGVVAPANSPGFKGIYSYELTASTDQPYASYSEEPEMVLVDSDTNSALLSSTSNESTSFGIFVHNQQDPAIWGLQNSFCGLQNHAQIKGNINGSATGDVDSGMMPLSLGKPQQHFYVKTLNGSAAYYGIKAIAGNSGKSGSGIPGGGGTVYNTVRFTTKSDNNCAVIFNLSFCSNVAYAVPSNLHTQPNLTTLGSLYDTYAANLYQNFSNSLQQIACDTTSSAQYSLARDCNDCDNAYKTWLCAVTIPRCEDYSNNAPYLQPRAVGQNYPNGSAATNLSDPTFSQSNKTARYMNSSRNPMIDWQIQPGPYKEVLPCADICYEVVRSCPASLGFACPLKGHGLNYTYGFNSTGELSCNFPGAVAGVQGSAARFHRNTWIMTAALFAGLIVSL
ncbi:MAG: hypothetical protein Q9191_006689 [Dirinaria sp. TL-2023a]